MTVEICSPRPLYTLLSSAPMFAAWLIACRTFTLLVGGMLALVRHEATRLLVGGMLAFIRHQPKRLLVTCSILARPDRLTRSPCSAGTATVMSACPDKSADTRVDASGTVRMMTFSKAGAPPQYCGLASSVRSPSLTQLTKR